jgi:hypothetical protein
MHYEKITKRPRSYVTFEDACAHLAKVHGLSKLNAMEKAAERHPDLVKRYNSEGAEIAKAAADSEAATRRTPRAVDDFEEIVAGIAKCDGVPKYVAMESAREAHPEEFERFQEA